MEKQVNHNDSYLGKKIIIAITKSNLGGAQKYVLELAKALKNKGYLVKVMLGGEGDLSTKLEKYNIEIIKIKSLQRDVSILKEFKVFFEILEILRQERPDVLHLNSSKIGGTGSLSGRIMGIKKIIFTAHGFAFNENRNFISKNILKFLYWLTFLLAHKTIFVSGETKIQAPKFLLPKNKFEIIYNAVSPIIFLSKQEARDYLCQKNPDLDPTKKWIGSLAELHHIKGIDRLVEVAPDILKEEDVQFVIFGEGEERKNLENRIEKLEIRKNFILSGYLKDASKYLKSLDLFVLPSRSEAMPLSILEAMQAQIPIVASNVGGIKEMIPEDCLFAKGELGNKILEKINSHPSYNLEKFSFEEMINKTERLY